MQESAPLSLGTKTTQSLVKNSGENFYGGGTQNGRFVHTGETIHIANESNWVDGGVASPNPFYYSSNGYGVLRNTFLAGSYDFGNNSADTVATAHNENKYDAYIFLSDGANAAERVQDLLGEYYHVTGAPVLLPEYAFYEGHLNATTVTPGPTIAEARNGRSREARPQPLQTRCRLHLPIMSPV